MNGKRFPLGFVLAGMIVGSLLCVAILYWLTGSALLAGVALLFLLSGDMVAALVLQRAALQRRGPEAPAPTVRRRSA